MLWILVTFSLKYILFSTLIKMLANLIGKLCRAAVSHLRWLQTLLESYVVPLLATSGFIVATSGVPDLPEVLYSIFTRHVSSKSEDTYRLPHILTTHVSVY